MCFCCVSVVSECMCLCGSGFCVCEWVCLWVCVDVYVCVRVPVYTRLMSGRKIH